MFTALEKNYLKGNCIMKLKFTKAVIIRENINFVLYNPKIHSKPEHIETH